VWVASPYFNTCGLLLEAMASQVDAPATTFDAFLEAYRKRLAAAIAVAVDEQNALRQGRYDHGGKPLQSVFTRDCIERGQDIDRGGARYNWVECSFVGLANLADSLYVLREEVFEQRRMTMAEARDILDRDFEGSEDVRQRWLHHYPKYGQGDAHVDALVAETVAFVISECAAYRMKPDDSPYVPGAFVWVMHERLGGQTGATPDGRKAGFPFADGCGPAQGRESRGPTAAILSTTSWDHSPMIGGLAFNMKFSRGLFSSPGASRRLQSLLVTFLERGGFETQVNVVDAEILRRARKNPGEYRDLVVRVGGYCDYFTTLSPRMQDEVILRTAFEQV
jgi:formate C-acetyltransferase